jgi:ElaB/YqjD/DUF883 family membrane-anchored ribosome-binding protein
MLDQTSTTPTTSAGTQARERVQQPEPASLTQTADQALQSLNTLYGAAESELGRRMQDNPYATLAVAAGVGFVLGGGLRSSIGQVLVRLSVKTLAPPLVNMALHNALERANALAQPPTR